MVGTMIEGCIALKKTQVLGVMNVSRPLSLTKPASDSSSNVEPYFYQNGLGARIACWPKREDFGHVDTVIN